MGNLSSTKTVIKKDLFGKLCSETSLLLTNSSQRRNFYYLSGVQLPDCSLVYNLSADHLTLFLPPLNPDDVVWSGNPTTPEQALQRYDIDAVETTSNAAAFLSSSAVPKGTAYAIPHRISKNITFLPFSKVDLENLDSALGDCRIVKDEYELALLRHANAVTTEAHTACQKLVTEGHKPTREQDFLSAFTAERLRNGCYHEAYGGIFASGTNSSTLHYVHNDQPLSGRLNILIDAGAEYHCYAADVTRTFPLSGKFSTESAAIYTIVQDMQDAAFALCRAGMMWDDVHSETHRVAIRGLLHLGLLHGGTEQEIFDSRASTAFFPHGLGHYMGMDTHDTGGRANYADKNPMFRYLRVRGKVPAGAVITVEPGIYFCRFILEPAIKDTQGMGRFIDADVVERYWEVGGVRIEDDIVVTEKGYENLTTAPKGLGL